MAERRDTRAGPAERAAAAVPPPAGRAYRFVVVTLLALSTASLVAVAALLWLVLGRLEAADAAALRGEVTGLKGEVAAFRADVAKGMAGLQKSMARTGDDVNAATLQLNDIALGLHRRP